MSLRRSKILDQKQKSIYHTKENTFKTSPSMGTEKRVFRNSTKSLWGRKSLLNIYQMYRFSMWKTLKDLKSKKYVATVIIYKWNQDGLSSIAGSCGTSRMNHGPYRQWRGEGRERKKERQKRKTKSWKHVHGLTVYLEWKASTNQRTSLLFLTLISWTFHNKCLIINYTCKPSRYHRTWHQDHT